ncbi:MAG: hypothetical protein COA77_08070 [Thaumarchaeota archaeon]|nr:MAG: hypothetical protein COA77_08070 [Nitrososphaerota archaeon]
MYLLFYIFKQVREQTFMGGTRLESDGTADAKIISEAIKDLQESNTQLQEDNAKATSKYLKITIIATFTSTTLGVIIGKFVLT